MIVTDETASIVAVNRKAAESLGYTIEELETLSVADIDVLWGKETLDVSIAQHLARGKTVVQPGRQRRKDGGEFDVEVRVSMVVHNGRVLFVSVIQDRVASSVFLDELRSKEAQWLQARRLESLGLYAAGAVHDLNNFLTPVLLEAESLAKDLPDPSVQGRVEVILSAVQMARDVIEPLLCAAGSGTRGSEVIDLSGTLRSLEALLRSSLSDEVVLSMELPREAVRVRADARRVAQAVLNLVLNARDAMKAKGGRLRLSLEARRPVAEGRALRGGRLPAGDYAVVEVADEGEGIAPQDLVRVFKPFFTTKTPGHGTGLGLASVQEAMTHLGGAAEVTSVVGEGTTFELFFPIEVGPQSSTEAAPGPRAVLLIEEDEAVRSAMVACLQRLNYRTYEVSDVRAALRCLETLDDEIECVISTLEAADGDEDTLFTALRAAGYELPLIFTTPEPLSDPTKRTSYGYPVLRKPFVLPELERALATVRPV